MSSAKNIVVVGAGLTGLTLASLLAKRGHQVKVLEKRADADAAAGSGDVRSISLTLSPRGREVLAELGLHETIKTISTPVCARAVHLVSGVVYQPYDTVGLVDVSRRTLHRVLMKRAEMSVSIAYGCEVIGIDKKELILAYRSPDGDRSMRADLVVGADGAFSKVRQALLKNEPANFSQTFFDWSYKQFNFSARLRSDCVHVWPANDSLVVAIPTGDGGFNANLFLKRGSTRSFAELSGCYEKFLSQRLFDLAPWIENIAKQLESNPENYIAQILTNKWHYRNKIVLVGDACHAMYHFYAQGLNAGLEDCSALDRCLAQYGLTEEALEQYQDVRRSQTDSMAKLSQRNFDVLRCKVGSASYHANFILERAASRVLGRLWLPSYKLIGGITHSYDRAERIISMRARLSRGTGLALVAWSFAGLLSVYRWASMGLRALSTRCRPGQQDFPTCEFSSRDYIAFE